LRTITLSNNKGGSAKTTTTVSLAAAFAETGLRILVVDLDPQGSTTSWLGGSESTTGLVEYAAGRIQLSDLVVRSTTPKIDLIPSSSGLLPKGEGSGNEVGHAIVRAFARLPTYWDLVLIDTPPTVGYLSLAPLVGSDGVVIPVEVHALALPGVASVIASVERARQHINPHLELLGIVACRVSATIHTREVITRLRSEFGGVVLDQTVREAIQIAEAPALRIPITRHAPKSRVADDYRAVASELLQRIAGPG
jgi:chromosome partitioning protein